jgi:hypothetical protein
MGNTPIPLRADLVTSVQICVREAQGREQEETVLAEDPGGEHDFLIVDSSWKHPDDTKSCQELCMEHVKVRANREEDNTLREGNSPFVHLGSVASSAAFIANPPKRDQLMKQGYLCAEMEAASIAEKYPTSTIRGVMDYCDSHRHHAKEWRDYAAVTAAATARLFISLMPPATEKTDVATATPLDSQKRSLPGMRHYLDEMPLLCPHYQPQAEIDDKIQSFWLSEDTRQCGKLLLYGLSGRGKTQSCVAYMNAAEENPAHKLV